MDFVTYGLNPGQSSSDLYYHDAAAFTDQVLLQAEDRLASLTGDFQSFLAETDRQRPRTKPEYIFELLVMGTLWRIYGKAAYITPRFSIWILSILAGLRQRNNCLKPVADFFRGILQPFLLVSTMEPPEIPIPAPGGFNRLLNWLKATGEFNQEVKRLQAWQDYWSQQSPAIVSEAFMNIIEFAAWFELKSAAALGKYTMNVEKFLHQNHFKRRFREDYFFCGRRRVEYHLNMVGAEIMNRAFRQEFRKKKRKVLILPSCMRNNPGGKCKAIKADLGLKCTGCTAKCRVNRLTGLGVDNDFEVYVIPHESSLFNQGVEKPEVKADLGVIGVACVLNLIAGGWKVKALEIPPQCVLLNYCGCKNHWHTTGFPTEIDMNQLLRVLGDADFSF